MPRLLSSVAALGAIALAAVGLGLPSASAATQPHVSQSVVVQQVATSGPNGPQDEYIELRNVSTNPMDLSGWHLKVYNAANAVILDFVVPDGIVLSPKFNTGQYLILVGPNFGGTIADATNVLPFTIATGASIPDNGGIAIFNAQNDVTKIDGVSFGPASTPREGAPAVPMTMLTAQLGAASSRDIVSTGTDNNRVDFSLHARTPGGLS